MAGKAMIGFLSRRDNWIFLSVCLISWFLFLLMAPHHLQPGDATELTYGIKYQAPIHAPGYPLYRLIGDLFVTVGNWSYPRGVHLFSALFGALSLGVFYLYARRRGLGSIPIALGLLTFALSPPVWPLVIQAEVYSMALFFFCVTLFLWDRVLDGENSLLFLCFWVGLSLTHHPVAVLNLFFIIHAFFREKRYEQYLPCFLILSLPGLLYFLLAIPGKNFPFQWPEIVNMSGVFAHMLGGSFKRFFMARGLLTPFYQLGRIVLAHLSVTPFFLIVFSIFGYIWSRGRERLLITVQVIFLFIIVFYDVPDISDLLIPSFFLLALFLIRGIHELINRLNRVNSTLVIVVSLICLGAWPWFIGFDYDRDDRSFPTEYVKDVDRIVENGTIVSDWGIYTVLRYHQLDRGNFRRVRLLVLPPDFDLNKLYRVHQKNDIPLYITSKTMWNLSEKTDFLSPVRKGLYRVYP